MKTRELADTSGPLFDELRRAATAEDTARINGARAEAARLRTDAEVRIAARVDAARADRARAAERALDLTRVECSARLRSITLPARAEALDRIFARARERIAARASHPGLPAAVSELLGDALRYLPDGPVRVRCGSTLSGVTRAALDASGRTGSTVLEDEVPLGLFVETPDGSIAVDATFDRRLSRDRVSLSTEVARALMEDRA